MRASGSRQNEWGKWRRVDNVTKIRLEHSKELPIRKQYNRAMQHYNDSIINDEGPGTPEEYTRRIEERRRKEIDEQAIIDNTSRSDLIRILTEDTFLKGGDVVYKDKYDKGGSAKGFYMESYPHQWREAHRTKDVEFLKLVYEKIPQIIRQMYREDVQAPMNIMRMIIKDNDLATAVDVKDQIPHFAFAMLIMRAGDSTWPIETAIRNAESAKRCGRSNDNSIYLLKVFQELMNDMMQKLSDANNKRAEERSAEENRLIYTINHLIPDNNLGRLNNIIASAAQITQDLPPLSDEELRNKKSPGRSCTML